MTGKQGICHALFYPGNVKIYSVARIEKTGSNVNR